MLGRKRDCYDTFTGSQDEKDLITFCQKSPFDQWKELMLQTKGLLQEAIISEGFRLGFCDKEGSLTNS